jgi:hypothetical protein
LMSASGCSASKAAAEMVQQPCPMKSNVVTWHNVR